MSVCVWWVEKGVRVSVGSLAGYLGECCHHLQAVPVEASPCFDPKPNVPFPLTCLLEASLEPEDGLSYSRLVGPRVYMKPSHSTALFRWRGRGRAGRHFPLAGG